MLKLTTREQALEIVMVHSGVRSSLSLSRGTNLKGASDYLQNFVAEIERSSKNNVPVSLETFAVSIALRIASASLKRAENLEESSGIDGHYQRQMRDLRRAKWWVLHAFGLAKIPGKPASVRSSIQYEMALLLYTPSDLHPDGSDQPECRTINAAATRVAKKMKCSSRTAVRAWGEYNYHWPEGWTKHN